MGTSITKRQGIPLSYWPFIIKDATQNFSQILVIAETTEQARHLTHTLEFLLPEISCLYFPGYQGSPFEGQKPSFQISSQRNIVLKSLNENPKDRLVMITTRQALSLYCPPQNAFRLDSLTLKKNSQISIEALSQSLSLFCYTRVDTVREPSEFAIRGGLVDIFPSHLDRPIRIDFFDQDIENMWWFDPLTQTRDQECDEIVLYAKSQGWSLTQQKECFRKKFRDLYGADSFQNSVYKAVTDEKFQNFDFWLPLFFDQLTSFFSYFTPQCLVYDQNFEKSYSDYFHNLLSAAHIHQKTNPKDFLPAPESLYLTPQVLLKSLHKIPAKISLSPLVFDTEDYEEDVFSTLKFWTKFGDNPLHHNATEKLLQWCELAVKNNKKLHVACSSLGQLTEIKNICLSHQYSVLVRNQWSQDFESKIILYVWPFQESIVFQNNIVLKADDLFIKTSPKSKKSSELFIAEATSLNVGDLVVHEEHGVGQFTGLINLNIDNIAHDCLGLIYSGGDKIYVPVENMDVLTRYGSEPTDVVLDKLGGSSWQQRKAKVKKDLLYMAQELLRIAAQRKIAPAPLFLSDNLIYQEFTSRFPHIPTEDQISAFQDIEEDLNSGHPMDRLVCGDVGFGKTEVALRAACLVSSQGKQVAIIVPTTLLARQHFETFQKRFEGLDIKISMLSRFTKPSEIKKIKEEIQCGFANIIIGTHSIFHESVIFADLGLIIIDEEQHFGVKQKEKLKNLKDNVHILTLSATPIPRTLQMSLSGVKDLSIIATPPSHRLSVFTQITPSSPELIREALLREKNRNGTSFYVCPRIKDLNHVHENLTKWVPELKVVIANGQMAIQELESVMEKFYDGKADVLLATNIIESGLDISRANTILIHRPDLFGLAQLYQLRGRVGRSTQQGYAYLMVPSDISMSEGAKRRLEVMQSLDTLGAGFQLASYDLDIRGAGNVLGQEQSGHIREVGVELYQKMLQEAILDTHEADKKIMPEALTYSPQINLGIPVFIPNTYINDLQVRLEFYKRMAHIETEDDSHLIKIELTDRFGPLPQEITNLFEVIFIKSLCRSLNIESLITGDRGVVIKFVNNKIKNPEILIALIQEQKGTWKVKPDQSLTVTQLWNTDTAKIIGIQKILETMKQRLLTHTNFKMK